MLGSEQTLCRGLRSSGISLAKHPLAYPNTWEKRVMTRSISMVWALGAAAIIGMAGCNQAKSPDAVQRDVNKAESSGESQVARAEQSEARTDERQESHVASAVDSANSAEVNAAVDTAVAQAEADNKVQLAKCESLGGAQQKACRDQANALLDAAKTKAKEIKSGRE
jgi:hypothetical protein